MPLKPEFLHTVPKGGYKYFIPQLGWPKDIEAEFGVQSLDVVAMKIRTMRLANPRFNSQPDWTTDLEAIRQQVSEATAICLHNDPRFCTPGPAAGGAPKKVGNPLRRSWLSQSVAAAIETAREVAGGVGAWLEWLGPTGEVVDQETANRRAHVCAHMLDGPDGPKPCPKNQGGGLLAWFSQEGADEVKAMLEVKHQMKLSTPYDGQLHVCSACHCPMDLKVWATLPFMLERLRPAQKADLHPQCWVLSEEKTLKP